MKMRKLTPPAVYGKMLILLFITISFASCKKDSSGNYSFFGSGIEELGNAEYILEEITNPTTKLYLKDSVAAFYDQRSYYPAWSNSSLRDDLLEALEAAEEEGLVFKEYHGERIKEGLSNLNDLSEEERSSLDVVMTDAFLLYGKHLYSGKTNPKDLHEIWDVPSEEIDHLALLEEALKENDLDHALEFLRPNHKIYNELKKSLKEYRELSANFEGFEAIPEGETVEPEEEDPRLPQIKERLKFFGHLDKADSTGNQYTPEVVDALKIFQEQNGIENDGIIGNNTIRFLNKGYDDRMDQILVNMERWRWYPRELGEHFILVNIANYRLQVVKDGDTVRTHKTMVGTEARKTPVFSREVKHLVFNPDWTIPPTIQNNDVIPGMKRNSSYLANRNIKIYDQSGNEVNPSSVNWSGEQAQNLTYRQNPGASNPLGRVKIMYPNEYLIYLHDTPSQALFERNSRAESSGCVRVEDAIGLARYLLEDQDDYSSDKINEIIESGKMTHVNMEQKVNVHHFYWTAWRENGKTRFTEDIYDYDSKLLEALKKAS
jgi:L,D-transpeptidase YcbB